MVSFPLGDESGEGPVLLFVDNELLVVSIIDSDNLKKKKIYSYQKTILYFFFTIWQRIWKTNISLSLPWTHAIHENGFIIFRVCQTGEQHVIYPHVPPPVTPNTNLCFLLKGWKHEHLYINHLLSLMRTFVHASKGISGMYKVSWTCMKVPMWVLGDIFHNVPGVYFPPKKYMAVGVWFVCFII